MHSRADGSIFRARIFKKRKKTFFSNALFCWILKNSLEFFEIPPLRGSFRLRILTISGKDVHILKRGNLDPGTNVWASHIKDSAHCLHLFRIITMPAFALGTVSVRSNRRLSSTSSWTAGSQKMKREALEKLNRHANEMPAQKAGEPAKAGAHTATVTVQ